MQEQTPNISVARLYTESLIPNASPINQCSLLRHTLQPGVDLLVWQSHFPEPFRLNVHDDMGRIHFTCALHGESCFSMNQRRHDQSYQLSQGNNCINFTPDCRGTAHYQGLFESLIISVDPAVLAPWQAEISHYLQTQLDSNCCFMQHSSHAEIHATAKLLSDTLKRVHQFPKLAATTSPLWLWGQSMVLISLILSQYQEPAVQHGQLSHYEQKKLLQARDHLLADLSQAPTIAALAHETGLSVLKIKRGFRSLFHNSVYGLFQQERMKEAKRRLSAGNVQVVTVATDLGYANASHFTTAFQKQFGVNPSAFKRNLSR